MRKINVMSKSDFHTIEELKLYMYSLGKIGFISILCFQCQWVNTWVDAFKKLKETMDQLM